MYQFLSFFITNSGWRGDNADRPLGVDPVILPLDDNDDKLELSETCGGGEENIDVVVVVVAMIFVFSFSGFLLVK